MDNIETEITRLIDRFRVADLRHDQALRRRQTYQHQTYSTLQRMPRTADPELEQLCRREDSAWMERDDLLGRVIDMPARSVAALAIKLRFALNHGRSFAAGESLEADADIVQSALRDAEWLASHLPVGGGAAAASDGADPRDRGGSAAN